MIASAFVCLRGGSWGIYADVTYIAIPHQQTAVLDSISRSPARLGVGARFISLG